MKNSNSLASPSQANIFSRMALLLSLPLMLLLITHAHVNAQTQTPVVVQEEATTTTNAVERATKEAVKAKSVVRGRAVYDDTDRPVRRARVMLLDMNQRGPERTGMTNGSGEFQIKEVPAGNYFVMVDMTGVITPISFVDFEDASGEKFNLEEVKKHFTEIAVDGTNDQTIKVRARKGGAISGKVTYADGDAAINVRVNIMRKKDGKLARFITNLNPSALFGIQTDDRGMYRIAGLPPGEYNISVAETVDHSEGRSGREEYYMGMNMFGGNSLLVTYYQGATDEKEATSLQVDAGQEYNEINISLVERVLHKLSGTVVARRDNKPLPNTRISIKSKTDTLPDFGFMSVGPGASTDEQGRFTLNEIPDGVYTLTVESTYSGPEVRTEVDEEGSPSTAPNESRRKLIRKQQDVTVNGNDVADLTITLIEGAILNGTVMVDGGKPLPPLTYVTMADASGAVVSDVPVEVQQDGSFTIDGLPAGAVYPNVSVRATSENYYVKSMTAGGADLMRDALAVGEGANINGVKIVISPDAATLTGRVLAPDATPVSGARFVLIPADLTRWRARISYLFGDSAGNGSYTVSGAPGEYLIVFMRPADQPNAINEAWIRERAVNAQRVTLLPKQSKSMNLTMPQ